MLRAKVSICAGINEYKVITKASDRQKRRQERNTSVKMSCTKCTRDTSFAFFLIYFVLFIVAFATPFWVLIDFNGKSFYFGLWLWCSDNSNGCNQLNKNVDSSMKGTRAMMCIAFIAYTISAIAYCVWIGKGKKYLREHGIGTIGMVALISALIGGVFNIIGSIIFGSHYDEDLFDFDIDHRDWDNEFLELHASYVCATLSGVGQAVNVIFALPGLLCCTKCRKAPAEEAPSVSVASHPTPAPAPATTASAPADVAPTTMVTVITESDRPPGDAEAKLMVTSADDVPPAAAPKFAESGIAAGYVPPGDYPAQGQYPLAGGYQATAGGYPPVAAYPGPIGYPAPMGYPPAGGYPAPVGYPQGMAIPNDYGPPPAYSESKEEQRL
ncbi:hypothetical protein LSH36_257g02019 [Paralvinella palmiformis]|uniref:Uncharacterized protein n=1 Tax=Paralvinella palmiformis TaxID=53620 RepID=A0AAD9JMI7_9ANNE|nr:hypothetical protein LSH36_257g02019 [Paralvinella palmiformis]